MDALLQKHEFLLALKVDALAELARMWATQYQIQLPPAAGNTIPFPEPRSLNFLREKLSLTLKLRSRSNEPLVIPQHFYL